MANETLSNAKKAKKDEFYTQLSDIENELRHYTQHFRGKTVLCNCDDPKVSNFFVYFVRNFNELGLKRLITTCYKNNQPDLFSQNDCEQAVWLDYRGGDDNNPDVTKVAATAQPMRGDGDFRSKECIELLQQADIVVTNPPFSLFREYVAQLIKYDKNFIIIGNQNAITYKEIFPLIKENKLWLGWGFNAGNAYFRISDGASVNYASGVYDEKTGLVKFRNCCWFTNLEHKKRAEWLDLYKHYTPEEYPKYDNYDAINVDKTADIPMDYDGVMGVPITFLDKYCPEQFEIMGITQRNDDPFKIKKYTKQDYDNANDLNARAVIIIDGKPKTMYARILIRKKQK